MRVEKRKNKVHFHRYKKTWIGLFLASFVFVAGLNANDDRYESENNVQRVRPPVLDGTKPFKVPFQIRARDVDEKLALLSTDLRKINGELGKDGMVVGLVESVFVPSGNNKVILNLGSDHRNCFKVVIDIRDFAKWGTSDPREIAAMYERKVVLSEGLITSYQNNPQILVALPHQLKIVARR